MYLTLDGPVGNDNDLLNVQNGINDNPLADDLAEKFWLFHVSFNNSADELVGISRSPGNFTVQNCYFNQPTGTGFGVLLYNTDGLGQWDQITQKSTWTRNYWNSIDERAPRIGVPSNVHLFNNYWDDWTHEGIIVVSYGGLIAQALLENNVADATGQGTRLTWPFESGLQSGEIKGNGNMLLSGAFIEERNSENVFTPPYLYTAETATTALRDDIIANAGWQDVPFPD